MRKWIGPFFSIFLVILLVLIFGPFHISKQMISQGGEREGRIILTQDVGKDEKKEEPESHYIQTLKQLEEKVDGWLKSLNEQIESEDITRFKVRFLEILRNILEWVKEKLHDQIESSKAKKPEKKGRGLFRETYQRSSPVSLKG